MRSGRPEKCLFETGKPVPAPKSDGIAQQTASHRDDPQIQELRADIAQLREVLHKIENNRMNTHNDSPRDSTVETLRDLVGSGQGLLPSKESDDSPGEGPRDQIIALKDRSPRGYYRQHTLFRFFDEVRFCAHINFHCHFLAKRASRYPSSFHLLRRPPMSG